MAPAFVSPLAISGTPFTSNVLCSARRDPAHVIGKVPRSRRVRYTPAPVMTAVPVPSDVSLAPIVPILMGSASDMPYCQKIADALSALGVASDLRVASAHKVPGRLLQVLEAYESDPRPKVYIGVAGRSNALSGMLDCAVAAPVISCPPPSDSFAGADIYSSLRMPGGVAPALVLEPGAAALIAAKILGISAPPLREAVAALQKANRDRLYVDDAESVTKTYVPAIAAKHADNATITETSSELIFGAGGASEVEAVRNGKVRDQYDFTSKSVDGVEQPLVALVTTDRQSAFDRILAAIPYKGAVLNMTAAWWFEQTKHIIPNHVVAVPHPNITVAKRCTPFPVEFVVRGYITGSTSTSLWKNYSSGVRNYCGISFPDGLLKNQKLEANVLTPTTKEVAGDRPIAPADVIKEGFMTQADWDVCATAAMRLFEFGQKIASDHGLILVDTKYEFGRTADGTICLIDEIHTPDSSRYWLATSYAKRLAAGKEPENVDKEFLRLWFRDNCDPYDKSKDLPTAPTELVEELSRKYIMLYELITGETFDLDVGVGSDRVESGMRPFVDGVPAHSR